MEKKMSDEQDNIEAAMDKVASSMKLTRKSNTGSVPGEPAQKQVMVRATEADHDKWKRAAEREGKSMAEFIRDVCNEASKEALECRHPPEFRKSYPWSEFCLKCNHRIR
jgi:predicted HicB family RNase H-like nuclease